MPHPERRSAPAMQVSSVFRIQSSVAAILGGLLLTSAACDFGKASRENDVGPPINVRSTLPISGSSIAADGTITIEVDRLLDPESIDDSTVAVVGADDAAV